MLITLSVTLMLVIFCVILHYKALSVMRQAGDWLHRNHVEGMEKSHRWRVPPLGIDTRDQGHAHDGNGVAENQEDQRHTHAPQNQEQRVVHFSAGTSRFRSAA